MRTIIVVALIFALVGIANAQERVFTMYGITVHVYPNEDALQDKFPQFNQPLGVATSNNEIHITEHSSPAVIGHEFQHVMNYNNPDIPSPHDTTTRRIVIRNRSYHKRCPAPRIIYKKTKNTPWWFENKKQFNRTRNWIRYGK